MYEGLVDFDVLKSEVDHLAVLKTKVMMNVGNPSEAFALATLPCDGIGLARCRGFSD